MDFGLPLTDSLKLFIDSTQQYVSGDVRIKLFKGNAIVNGRKSPYTLYDEISTIQKKMHLIKTLLLA